MIATVPPVGWILVGLLGQAVFTARFVLQWFVSERRRESVVPTAFWWLSLAGSALLVLYAGVKGDPVFVLGSLVSGFLYARNLILIHSGPEATARKRVLVPIALAVTLVVLWSAWPRDDSGVPLRWLVLGFAGMAFWSGRFVIQWFASERAGRSVMPRSFWYAGLTGSALLLAYSVHRADPVFILGYLFPPVPYVRNLVLIYRKEGAPAPVAWAADVWRGTRSRRIAIALFAVLAAGFLTARVLRTDEVAGDFLRYHRAGRMVLTGEGTHLYDRHPHFDVYPDERYVEQPFRYLPAFAVVMAPVAALPPKAAELLWTWLNALNYVLILWISWRLCERFGGRAAWMWIPFFLTIRFGWGNLNLGQINPTVIMLAMAGVFFAETNRPLRGGALAGLAAAIKLTPLLVLAALLFRRQYAAFGIGVLVFLVVTFALPAAVLGPGPSLDLAGQVAERQGTTLVVDSEHDEVPGESLKAMAFRLLGPYPFHKHWRRIDVSTGWLDPAGALIAYRILAATFLAWFLWFALRKRGRLQTPLVWGAAFLTALLVSPETRQAHFLSLALPVTAVTMVLAAGRIAGPRRIAVLSLLALAFLLAGLPARAIVGKPVAYTLAALCASGFAALLLLVATGLCSTAAEEDPVPEGGSP
ncbi:MAG: lipid-A-disaccharide synthase N-terminal domain-containing protein [Planctomycetota bacterium]